MIMSRQRLDVAIVGAGAAGVGCGIVLRELGIERFALLDRIGVGASFERWPREMRFITPSFPSNAFGMLDLNAIALDTSPAYTLGEEHPTGRQYAQYLRAVADYHKLPVSTGLNVVGVSAGSGGEGFSLSTSRGEIEAKFVIWACGEFQYPNLPPFAGASICRHIAQVSSWRRLKSSSASKGRNQRVVVIGGYESGIDAAVHLVRLGNHVTVLDRHEPWESNSADPSVSLSPYTLDRLDEIRRTGRVELVGNVDVRRVQRTAKDHCVRDAHGNHWSSDVRPINATGFAGGLGTVRDHFEWRDDGFPLLNEWDESTRTEGLFVSGPAIRHDDVVLCFIYKFRQRFAVVGAAIANRLGIDAKPLDRYRESGMYLEDFSCCGQGCAC